VNAFSAGGHDGNFSPITVSRPSSSVSMYFKPGTCSKPSLYPTPSPPTNTGAVVTIRASTRRSERNDCMTRAPPSTMTERIPLSRSVRRTAGRGSLEVAGRRSGSAWRQRRRELTKEERTDVWFRAPQESQWHRQLGVPRDGPPIVANFRRHLRLRRTPRSWAEMRR